MKYFLLKIVDVFMPKRWYICHKTYATFVFGNVTTEENYFGPFTRRGAKKRLGDEYASLLLFGEDDLYMTRLSWSEARQIPFIASKDFWDSQAEALTDDEPAAWQEEN